MGLFFLPNGPSYSKTSSWETCEKEATTSAFTNGIETSSTFSTNGVEANFSSTDSRMHGTMMRWIKLPLVVWVKTWKKCAQCNVPCLNDDQQNYNVWQFIPTNGTVPPIELILLKSAAQL